jgi:hypothetical protein
MDKGEGLEQKSNDWERAKRKHIDWGHTRKFWGRPWKIKDWKKEEVEIAFTWRQVKDKGRRTPIKSMKSKRNFNQGKAQQKSIAEKRLSYKRDFWYPL